MLRGYCSQLSPPNRSPPLLQALVELIPTSWASFLKASQSGLDSGLACPFKAKGAGFVADYRLDPDGQVLGRSVDDGLQVGPTAGDQYDHRQPR